MNPEVSEKFYRLPYTIVEESTTYKSFISEHNKQAPLVTELKTNT